MTTLFCISRDPFKEWKPAPYVWREAHRRGLSVFVALDDRTTVEDAVRTSAIADTVVKWTSKGNCEDAYRFVKDVKDDWIFLVSDDEEPSDLAWRLSLEPPFKARFGIPIMPVLDGKLWRRDIGIQERLFPREGWRWTGGFEGQSESPHRQVVIGQNPGVIIWHRYPEAPREEREEKAARYQQLAPGSDHRARLIWEEHPDELVDMPAHVAAHLPKRRALH